MKLKKLMFTASSLAVGASLVGSILTSCSKATVDEKNKITLDDNGGLCTKETAADFKKALQDAFSRSSNWSTFKAALADEIVYRWYVDRAAENKDSNKKNPTFRVNLDEWTEKIKKDYEDTIKNLKNKYTDKWEFYLQNEVLDPAGGTEEAYKHAKLVEKCKSDFLSKVFATNYFGCRTGDPKGSTRAKYPSIYAPASLNISEDKLKDPENWKNLGFFARTNSSFAVSDDNEDVDTSFLAKNPDGDYATIQSYVFERWFLTEKPFFSAASLFKYSNPKYVAESKLSGIYDGVSTGVKIPDNPNESFPFFGAYPSSEPSKGTNAYIGWYEQLLKDGFDTQYRKGDEIKTNGTVQIGKSYTEDSQTLLLSFGSQMIGGSSNALYIPYANAASSLYLQMLTGDEKYAPLNRLGQYWIQACIDEAIANPQGQYRDNAAILKNFMFNDIPTGEGININSYLDLAKVYPGSWTEGNEYHCPLFKENKNYDFLYGTTAESTGEEKGGVRYVTNAVQVELGRYDSVSKSFVDTQPWIFELNEAGMHAQTIDGYRYVVADKADGTAKTAAEKQEALKEVIKYRLMQKKCGYNSEVISGDIFGDSGKLKSYFSDNFTNIVLEMAFDTTQELNIFKPIDSYGDATFAADQTSFLSKICTDEKLSTYADIVAYIKLTDQYDNTKKYIDAYETANSKTYAYRTKQMENARTVEKHLTVYENGLLAPLAYTVEVKHNGLCTRAYNTAEITMMPWDDFSGKITVFTREALKTILGNIKSTVFYQSLGSVEKNTDNALSPQVSTAKSKTSNRFWYKSYIVDKVMYSYMSNKDGMANFIKGSAMQNYLAKMFGSQSDAEKILTPMSDAFATVYGESKIFTNDRNYANFGTKNDSTAEEFYNNIWTGFNNDYEYKLATSGEHCDEYLNYWTYLATLTYLIGKDKTFENFYKMLNSKIAEDEMALVGYINKTNKNVFGKDVVNAPTTTLTEETKYDWTPDVNNIFDNTEYTGKTSKEGAVFGDAKIASDQYWKTINKKVGNDMATDKFLAGFTGLQTKSSNQLDSGSKLQAAAFDKFAKCSDQSRILSKGDSITDPSFYVARGDEKLYAENYGCWFAYAGVYEFNSEDKKVPYTFTDVTYDGQTVKASDFQLGENKYYPALKLAKRIAEYRSIDDLRDLAKKLGAAFYGDSFFRQIGDGTVKINNIDELKYKMLKELLAPESEGSTTLKYLKCFQRMTDAELHEEGSDNLGNKEYGFTDDKGNTYRILFTQINKADVTEKNFEPKWENEKWTANANSPIQLSEFWYILAAMANEASVQQMAITDVVKTVYGDDKLVVYDAQLYNCFDSVWIKDWSKKTMGA